MGVRADCENVVNKTIELLGGLDILISNAVSMVAIRCRCSKTSDSCSFISQGWTKFAKFGDLNGLTDDEWDKVSKSCVWSLDAYCAIKVSCILLPQCWFTNVKGNLHLFRAAESTFTANPEGGVFIITSSVAVGFNIQSELNRRRSLIKHRVLSQAEVAWRTR